MSSDGTKSCVGLCFEILPICLSYKIAPNNFAVEAKLLRRSKNHQKLREIAAREKKVKR